MRLFTAVPPLGVSYYMSLAQEMIKNQNTVSSKCIFLVYHHKVEKLSVKDSMFTDCMCWLMSPLEFNPYQNSTSI
jgi:hypothetical protein